MEYERDAVGAAGALLDVALGQHKGVVTGAVDFERRVPPGHHVGLRRPEQAPVGLVPVPHVRRVAALAEPQVAQAVLVVPATVGRVDNVQLSVGVHDGLRAFVDVGVAHVTLPLLIRSIVVSHCLFVDILFL